MKFFAARKATAAVLLVAALCVSACSTGQVIDNTVDATAGVTKFAAKGVVGAGKLAYQGGSAAFGAE